MGWGGSMGGWPKSERPLGLTTLAVRKGDLYGNPLGRPHRQGEQVETSLSRWHT